MITVIRENRHFKQSKKKRVSSCSHSVYPEEKESTASIKTCLGFFFFGWLGFLVLVVVLGFFNEKQCSGNCAVTCWSPGLLRRGNVLLGHQLCFWLAQQAQTAKCLSAYKVSGGLWLTSLFQLNFGISFHKTRILISWYIVFSFCLLPLAGTSCIQIPS